MRLSTFTLPCHSWPTQGKCTAPIFLLKIGVSILMSPRTNMNLQILCLFIERKGMMFRCYLPSRSQDIIVLPFEDIFQPL